MKLFGGLMREKVDRSLDILLATILIIQSVLTIYDYLVED
jgi:hypothetical protein